FFNAFKGFGMYSTVKLPGEVEEVSDLLEDEDSENLGNNENFTIGEKILKNPKDAFIYSEIFNRKY
ncbi:hypothetical protein, partial [Lagierella sp.]|uniref:hypothetical protein n=1 Tax=Lagierella sp. TaxID=2849657 RepID=UPI00262A2D5F